MGEPRQQSYTLEPIWPILLHGIHIVSEYDVERIHGPDVACRMLEAGNEANQTLMFNDREWFRYSWYVNQLSREANATG